MGTISHAKRPANPDGRARAERQLAWAERQRAAYDATRPAGLSAEDREAWDRARDRHVRALVSPMAYPGASRPTKGYLRGLRRGAARLLARLAPLPVLALPVRARGVLRVIAGGRRETRHGAPRRPSASPDAPEPPPPSETRPTGPARLALVLASHGRSFAHGPIVVADGRVAYAAPTLADLEREGVNVAELRSALADEPEGVGIVVEGVNGPSFGVAVGGALRRVGGGK